MLTFATSNKQEDGTPPSCVRKIMEIVTKKYIGINEDNKLGANFLKIEVSYSKGGFSWATGNIEPRGYYLHVSPVERKISCGYETECYHGFTGSKMLLNECGRKSKKAESEAILLAVEKENKLVEYVLKDNGLKMA